MRRAFTARQRGSRPLVDSLAGPRASGGAGLALAVAARCDAVLAVAAIEPNTPRVMDDQERAALAGAIARMGALAAEGRSTDAARAFGEFVFDEEEVAVAEAAGYFQAAGRYVPQLLSFFRQLREHQGPTHEDPAVLGTISAPVLVLIGSDTKPYATAYARHVVDHVPHARIAEIPGAGHAAPLTRPAALAGALTAFFSPAQQPT